MRQIISLCFSILFTMNLLHAQDKGKWSKDALNLQFRFESRNADSLDIKGNYQTKYDFAVGQLYNYQLNDRFTLVTGGALSFASYEVDQPYETFVASFKRNNIHHFDIGEARLMNLEIPLLLEMNVLRTRKNNSFSFLAGFRQQLNLYSSFQGDRFDEETLISGNRLFHSETNSFDPAVFNDFRVETVLRWEQSFKKYSLVFDLGSQYSLVDKGASSFLRVGLRFR